MNILHYSLGFPPYRTGGLTKFCMDLMREQIKEGHKVSLLWPGEMVTIHQNTYIRKHGQNEGIVSYEVINPTPIPYDEGIVNIEAFMQPGDKKVYVKLLKSIKPDIIHIHTLMGLHKTLLDAAKDLNIKIIFSAHDFFPICPKVTMFRKGEICNSVGNCVNCPSCNLTALSITKIKILQSAFYRGVKDTKLVKKLRKQHRDSYIAEKSAVKSKSAIATLIVEDYMHLRDYYRLILEYTDVIHYNSTVTQNVYEQYMQLQHPKKVMISISHSDIRESRKRKRFSQKLRLTYLGPPGEGKGFGLLKSALDKIWNDNRSSRRDFSLNVFFHTNEVSPYIITHERYNYSQLEEIFDNTDALVTPSIWYETFGYTVLESLSFGVPVIISDTVGAKDIVPENGGIIIVGINADKLEDVIRGITIDKLELMNQTICDRADIMQVSDMSRQITSRCYKNN